MHATFWMLQASPYLTDTIAIVADALSRPLRAATLIAGFLAVPSDGACAFQIATLLCNSIPSLASGVARCFVRSSSAEALQSTGT
jgi:hypothetical protein